MAAGFAAREGVWRTGSPAWVSLVVALVIAVVAVPPLIGGYVVQAAASYLIFGLLALGVGVISGYGRLFNIGVGVNFGIGAYAVAVATSLGVSNPFALLLCAVGAGALAALLFSFYAMIASGVEYLMLTFLTTLAFAAIPAAVPEILGGDNGLRVQGNVGISFGINPLRGNGFYWLVVGVVLLCIAVAWFVLNSQAGKAVQAIGRNPVRAAAMGYNVSGYRIALTIFSGVIASLGGWLYALQTTFVFEALLGLGTSTNGLVYALVGGVDTIVGPFLGAAVLRFVTDLVSREGTQSSLYLGVVLMLVVYLMPEGIIGLLRRITARSRAQGVGKTQPQEEPDLTPGALDADHPRAL